MTKWIARLLAVLLVTCGLMASSSAAQAAPRWPDRIELPHGFQPEGITIGRKPVAYLGSRVDGDIVAADLRSGKVRTISQGPGTASVGLKVDRRERLLYVAGGPAGTGRVVDVKTGRIARTYTFTTAASFVNDVVLTRHGAWFTDSQQPQLYQVPTGWRGHAAPSDRFRTLPLRGDWKQAAGFNANGISQTPDHRALLVIQSGTGYLFRVNPRTGVARRVDLGGTLLTNGDGMLLKGRTLYVVRNQLNKVAVVHLNRAGTQGRLVRELTSPDFDVPSTVAAYRGSLYLPNARFSTPATPTTPYWITRISAR